jgi:excisionase family DNA binding protein
MLKKIVPFSTKLVEKLEESQNDMILPPLLSFEEVCEYLGLGHTIVSQMIKKGEIPHTRARNRIRVYATDLKEYLDKRRVVGK